MTSPPSPTTTPHVAWSRGATPEAEVVEPKLLRPRRGRVFVGVAAGIAEHLGWQARHIRWGFVALSLLGGAGIVAYLLLWLLTPAADVEGTERHAPLAARPAVIAIVLGLGLLVAVGFYYLDSRWDAFGGVGISTIVPVLVVAAGVLLAWSQLDRGDRTAFLTAKGTASQTWVRVAGGTALAGLGLIAMVARGAGVLVWDVVVATAAVVAGLALVLAPWGMRFYQRLRDEQATAIRESERASIAAHLHDSVLQTLALIQRADDPVRMTSLARRQERELRAWLYGAPTQEESTLAARVKEVAAEVEDLHGVPVDVVVTGDRPLDGPSTALVRAIREALLNAVRHGKPPVTAYVEVGPTVLEAFVRDRGAGFDPEEIPVDRLGVRESIIGRLERNGGTARIRQLDVGTEVALTLPIPTEEPT